MSAGQIKPEQWSLQRVELMKATAATIMAAFVLKWNLKQDTGMTTSIIIANFIAQLETIKTALGLHTDASHRDGAGLLSSTPR